MPTRTFTRPELDLEDDIVSLCERMAGSVDLAVVDKRIDALLGNFCGTRSGAADGIDHQRVRDLDPFGLDAELDSLPDINARRDVDTLTDWLRRAAATAAAGCSVEEALAGMRDLGMLMSSLQRLGVEPVQAAPGLEELLQAWAGLTGMVPRDTVAHYGLWNPTGRRERHFTLEAEQEGALIDSVRRSCRILPLAAAALDLAWHVGPTSPAGLRSLAVAADLVGRYSALFESVRRVVDPAYFAARLRPFFDPIVIGGRSWHGPAAAFVPLHLVDQLLWGTGEVHQDMRAESVEYGRPNWRAAAERVHDHDPLAAVLTAAFLDGDGQVSDELALAGDLVARALGLLVRFRGQHAVLAAKTYRLSVATHETGSGGFAPTTLLAVADLTRSAATELRGCRQ